MTGAARSVRAAIGWPRRTIRRRISLQLVVSHILVVLLTLVMVESVAIATLFGLAPDLIFPEGWDLDPTVGEKARAVAFRLDPALVTAAAAGDADALAVLDAELRAILPAPAGTTAEPDPTADSRPSAVILERIAGGLIVGPDGTVLVSTDPALAEPGRSVAEAGPLVGRATARAEEAAGRPVRFNEVDLAYSLEFADHVTAGSYPIFARDGRIVGYVTLQGQPFDITDYASARDIVRSLLKSEVRTLGVVTLAGLLFSIPAGLWRARLVSRRLKRLAAAADALAAGDLTHPVRDDGEDEIARVTERFDDMRERLAETDRARRAFVANVSHDLRTPVAIIQGHLERLIEGDEGGPPPPPSSPSSPSVLALLYRETTTLSRLIDDLFMLARVEETTLPLELRSVAIEAAAAEAVAGLKALAWAQQKVTVLSLVRPEAGAVRADPTRLRQILNNLLYNALRHTPSGGLIVVDARPAAERPDQLELSVADTGVGIPPEEQGSVFERFFTKGAQGAQGAQEGQAGNGSGLGLHIVKQLVEAMGGTIRVEERAEAGDGFSGLLAARLTRRVDCHPLCRQTRHSCAPTRKREPRRTAPSRPRSSEWSPLGSLDES